jgi:hypothetical protein
LTLTLLEYSVGNPSGPDVLKDLQILVVLQHPFSVDFPNLWMHCSFRHKC